MWAYLRSSAWRLSVSAALRWALARSSAFRLSATAARCWASACSSTTRPSSFTSELCRHSSSEPTCRRSSTPRELSSARRTMRCLRTSTRSWRGDRWTRVSVFGQKPEVIKKVSELSELYRISKKSCQKTIKCMEVKLTMLKLRFIDIKILHKDEDKCF